jgi:hypothetical protein
LRRLLCWFLGHRSYVVQEFTEHSRRIACERCKGDWAMNDSLRAVVPWCRELESLYQSMGIRLIVPWR